jgi:hypothetical protein
VIQKLPPKNKLKCGKNESQLPSVSGDLQKKVKKKKKLPR